MRSVNILLASNSPRRRQLLTWTGLTFRASSPVIDETALAAELPGNYVSRLAREKAFAAFKQTNPGEIILAADTIVADGHIILGKPVDREDAFAMLHRLRGKVHQVYTALTLISESSGEISDLCIANVPMREYRETEIESYVASGDPFDKAGAYAIQHSVFSPVINFEDCYTCVMGLPLCHLVRSLQKLNVVVAFDVPRVCQQKVGYCCPVYKQVLEHKV